MALDLPYGQFAQRVLAQIHQKLPPRSRRPAVLLTGFSSALDFALADAFARRGYDVALCCQDRAPLLSASHELRGRHPDIRVETILIDEADTAGCEKLRNAVNELGMKVQVVLANVCPVLSNGTPFAPVFTPLLGDMVKKGNGRLLISASFDAGGADPSVDPSLAFDVAMGLWKMLEGRGLAVASMLVGPVTAGSETARLADNAYQSLTFGNPSIFKSVAVPQVAAA